MKSIYYSSLTFYIIGGILKVSQRHQKVNVFINGIGQIASEEFSADMAPTLCPVVKKVIYL